MLKLLLVFSLVIYLKLYTAIHSKQLFPQLVDSTAVFLKIALFCFHSPGSKL